MDLEKIKNGEIKNLRSANLRSADLCSANLRSADLCSANLRSADLRSADLCGVRLPSPTMVLLANWGNLSDWLTAACMHFDAFCHPEPGAFEDWMAGWRCPYDNCKVLRAVNFEERPECWRIKVPPMSCYQLMSAILKEKCKGWAG